MTSDAVKTCLACAPGGTDLSELSAALLSHGYRLVGPASDILGRGWMAVLRESLSAVDLVVAVLPDTSPSVLNTVFELGVALALDRPVLVVAGPTFDELPLALGGVRVVRASATTREALDFALDTLRAMPSGARALEPVARPTSGAHGPRASTEEISRRINEATGEADIISLLGELFLAEGADVVSEARIGPRKADLAVWSDAMAPFIGNPLIVEVKFQQMGRGDAERALATLTNYVHASGSPWGLLVYRNGPATEHLVAESRRAARVLLLSFEELLEGIRTKTLFELLRMVRNRKVHGAP